MGIKSFFKLKITGSSIPAYENKLMRELGVNMTYEELKGKILAIDASIFLYANTLNKSEMNNGIQDTSHIKGIIVKVCQLHRYGIKQIWVFDLRNKSKHDYDGKSHNMNTKREDIYKLFNVMGVRYLIAPNNIQAEKVCCYLLKHNKVDYILSRDSDVLFYGGSLLTDKKSTDKKKPLTYYNLEVILQITQMEYIDRK